MAEPIYKEGTDDGWHGTISPTSNFKPEEGRYHLYIGLFCPFAHRVNLVRSLKGLTGIISMSVVSHIREADEKGWPGWEFARQDESGPATRDELFDSKYLHEVYFRADEKYKGKYSVPLLWDKKEGTIVNNESGEMIRWLPTAFDSILPSLETLDLYPRDLRSQIDSISKWLQRDFNIGVYKAGFATTQEVYNKNVIPVFAALNKLEELIYVNGGPYVLGERLTELDIRAYVTVVRFDTAYEQIFKCNLGTIRHDYPVVNNWLKNLYWNVKGFRETTNFKHIKEGYARVRANINPTSITPMGPFPDIEEDVELNWNRLKPGGVKLPAVLEYSLEHLSIEEVNTLTTILHN